MLMPLMQTSKLSTSICKSKCVLTRWITENVFFRTEAATRSIL